MTFAGVMACVTLTMTLTDAHKHWHKGKTCRAFWLLVPLGLSFSALLFAVDLTS